MNTSEIFLIALLLILAAPYLVWRLLRTDYVAPLVVVQVICGIVLGPGVLGHAFPDYYAFVFNPQVTAALGGVALWGVMIFVWLAGIELDLKQAWARRTETGVTAGLALGAPLLFGAVVAAGMLRFPGWAGPRGHPWQVVLGIGMACAVTALPILVLLLEKLDVLRHPLGQRVLRYASLDDVAIWGVLALILLDWDRMGRQALFLAGFGVLAVIVRLLMKRLKEADRWYVGLIWLAACGFGSDWSGLHFMVGAFLAGAVLDNDWFDRARLDQFRHTVLVTVMPVYFLSTGLRTQWELGGVAVFAAAGLLLAASVAGKLAGVSLAGRVLRWGKDEAWTIGWLLQTKGLVMIVFANILLDKGIITNTAFTALLLMAVGSTMLTVPTVAPRLRALGGREAGPPP